jgi:hypothetical protein
MRTPSRLCAPKCPLSPILHFARKDRIERFGSHAIASTAGSVRQADNSLKG